VTTVPVWFPAVPLASIGVQYRSTSGVAEAGVHDSIMTSSRETGPKTEDWARGGLAAPRWGNTHDSASESADIVTDEAYTERVK